MEATESCVTREFSDIINYNDFEVAVSLEPAENQPTTEKVPQYVTILGARRRPSCELPFGITLRKGGEWSTIQDMLKEFHPVNTLTKLRGEWKKRTEEEILPSSLSLLRNRIEERYAVAGIDFGCEPTYEDVYEREHELEGPVKERLIRAYGQKSESISVI